jgi:hypothetical protein
MKMARQKILTSRHHSHNPASGPLRQASPGQQEDELRWLPREGFPSLALAGFILDWQVSRRRALQLEWDAQALAFIIVKGPGPRHPRLRCPRPRLLQSTARSPRLRGLPPPVAFLSFFFSPPLFFLLVCAYSCTHFSNVSAGTAALTTTATLFLHRPSLPFVACRRLSVATMRRKKQGWLARATHNKLAP